MRHAKMFVTTLLLGLVFSRPSLADKALLQEPPVQHFIQQMVKKHHFQKQALESVFQQAKIQQTIIDAMDRPYEKKSWDVYKRFFLTPSRLQGGLAFWQKHQRSLARAEQQYGVPASMIVSIIGVETLYGERQGKFRVIDALATLAFHYPKRSAYFTQELEQFLLLSREHHRSPMLYTGSYAGAMGQPQFMPSSYRRFATSFSGSKHVDLMHDTDAAIASVAHYFQQHGWQTHQGVTQPARIRGYGIRRIDTNLKTAQYSGQYLRRFGIYPETAANNAPEKMGVVALETAQGPEYWLAYPNFYVITRYNSSPLYAMAVHLFAKQLGETRFASINRHYAYG